MLMLNFDFYDIYAVFLAFRENPLCSCNKEIATSLKEMVDSPQNDSILEPNVVRATLKRTNSIDKETFHWTFVDNVYTYGHKIIKDDFPYHILSVAFEELLSCLDNGNFEQFKALADALHNVPVILSDSPKQVKKLIKAEIASYRKNWNKNFLKEFLN